MKEAKGPGIWYWTTTDRKVSFSISSTTNNTSKILGISTTSIFTYAVT